MILLASESASRKAMLEAAGVAFRAAPARIDEAGITAAMAGAAASPSVRDVALRLAGEKALKLSRAHPGVAVLGSDSMLELQPGQWLDKPGSLDGLRAQLRSLRGRSHSLVSAAAFARDGELVWSHVEVATLLVRPFSEAWLESYVAACGEAVLSSVGGYHLEGLGAQLFERIEGDQFVVRGLPLLAVLAWLRNAGEMQP